MLADGQVLVSGGSAVNNDDIDVAYTSEIFDPATNTWSLGATATRMRLYHSTSLLLPDATVMTMGGGTPGPETNLNAEIYYPPYLFAGDGSPAVWPTITNLTPLADPGTTLHIETPDAAAVSRVSLVKLGSANRTPPGYYMVFVIDAAGVPSEAKFVKIGAATANPPPPTTTIVSPPPAPTDPNLPPPLDQPATVGATAERSGQIQLTEPPPPPAGP